MEQERAITTATATTSEYSPTTFAQKNLSLFLTYGNPVAVDKFMAGLRAEFFQYSGATTTARARFESINDNSYPHDAVHAHITREEDQKAFAQALLEYTACIATYDRDQPFSSNMSHEELGQLPYLIGEKTIIITSTPFTTDWPNQQDSSQPRAIVMTLLGSETSPLRATSIACIPAFTKADLYA